jgi:hypothetical protein
MSATGLKITVGPGIRAPYLALLTSYGEVQEQMRLGVQKLPPAFQAEVYERISHAYGKARDAGLGQANLTRNLTLLNDALIEVTNDVSNANVLISLFKGGSLPSVAVARDTFAKFSAEAQTVFKASMLEKLGSDDDVVAAIGLLKDNSRLANEELHRFDPSADEAKGRVKVGPAIKKPYLELLTAYGQIQKKMADDIAKLPQAFQLEVFARLSVQGQYSRGRDVSVGEANLTRNLTALNDVLIEVTTDVSIANHVAKGNPEATLEKFSPTAQKFIQDAMETGLGMSFKDAVAFVFMGYDSRQQVPSSEQRVEEHKGAKQVDRRLPPPSSQRDIRGLGLPRPATTRFVLPPPDETRRETGTGAGGRGLAHMVSSEGANQFTAPVDSTNAVYEF